MTDDATVHALTMAVPFGDRTVSITPTAIETDTGLLLVDVGPEGELDGLERALGAVGFELVDIEQVLLTHHDADHAGGLDALRDRTDVVVSAHPNEAPHVEGDEDPVKGAGDARYPPTPVDERIQDGDEFDTNAGPVRVVETHGHTAGHVSLYVPDQRLLVAGDALTSDTDAPLAGPKPDYTVDMDAAAASVDRLAGLDIDHVICHHGGYAPVGTEHIREIANDLADN